MWSLFANENLLHRVITEAKAFPKSYGQGITSPENQMWSLFAKVNLLHCVCAKVKAFPESFGHEFFLILATIAVLSLASFAISEVSMRIYPTRNRW
jgi:hypothetical protein